MTSPSLRTHQRFLRAALVVLLATTAVAQNGPTIQRIDPPNWWVGFEPQVMLLLTGEGLGQATVTTSSAGVRVVRTEPGLNARYLFVWLDTHSAKPGKTTLQVRTPAGSTNIDLPILRRSNEPGLHDGVSPQDVIYLIMPDRFADGDPSNDQPPGSTGVSDRKGAKTYHGGDLRGVRDHLGYLHDLGVTTLWLTPVWKNTDSDYHGYHVVDFYAIDERMGTLREYQDLVADAHKLGMKVLIDYVVNHTGPNNPWATAPPAEDWFHGTPQNHLDALYSFDGIVDPHAPAWESRRTLDGWFDNRLPDLNADNPLVAQYALDNALWWMEIAGLDGFRLDTFPYSSRRSWSGWNEGIFRNYPHTTTIGEVWNGDATITSYFVGGREEAGVDTHLSTVFDFPLYFALRDVVLKGQPVKRMVDVLERDWLYPHSENLVTFIGNHDTRRFMSEDGASKAKLEAAFALLLTMRGIPEIYAGDEIAMQGGEDPDNRRDFPGGFPGDARNAFTESGRTADENEVFNTVRALLKLRGAHSALQNGKHTHIAGGEDYYAFLRSDSHERLLVVFNNSASSRTLKFSLADTPLENAQRFEPLMGAQAAQRNASSVEVPIGADSVAIYSVQ